MSLRTLLKRIGADNAGATAIEYGLILGLIAIAALGVMQNLGNETTTLWNTVKDEATAVL
jgi:pilus assembly protein Flp/PilA